MCPAKKTVRKGEREVKRRGLTTDSRTSEPGGRERLGGSNINLTPRKNQVEMVSTLAGRITGELKKKSKELRKHREKKLVGYSLSAEVVRRSKKESGPEKNKETYWRGKRKEWRSP